MKVTDDSTGVLTIEKSDNVEALDFINTYDASGKTELKGTKFIENREFKDGDTATMKIEAITEGAPMPAEAEITVNPTSGTEIPYTFGEIEYKLSDLPEGFNSSKTFEYKVTESAYDMDGVAKDETEYTVTVKVTDDSTGALTIEKSDNAEALDFINTYTSAGNIQFFGKKILVNRTLKEGEFSFELKDEDGTVLQTVKNAADGTITFEPIEYTQDDMKDEFGVNTGKAEFIYTISEVKPEGDELDKTVIYDPKVVTITVTLEDLWDGNIDVTASDEAMDISFTNIVVKVSKVDVTSKEELVDAKIQIIEVDEEGNETVVFEFTSGEEATEIEDLEIGKNYILREVVAPHGYDVTSDTTFTVDNEGNITTTGNFTYDDEGNFILLIEDTMFKVSASVKKIWIDDNNRDGVRPISLNVYLMQKMADGTVKAATDKSGKAIYATLTAANGWAANVKSLPMVDGDLNDIEYFWTEEEIGAGYKATSETVRIADEVKTIGFVTTLTNEYSPEETNVSVKKVWTDDDNAYATRRESIRVQLYANGVACGEAVTLSAANGWAYTWTGLTKNENPTGQTAMAKTITYTVEELDVPEGYQATITGNGTTGFVITNVLERGKLIIEKTFDFEPIEPEEPDNTPMDIPVVKTWNDNGNKDGNRPQSVTVRLYADGVEVASAVITEADGWKTTFTGLDRYNGEEKINYTISEDPVDWYTAEIHGYNIRNNYQPEVTSVTVRKVWNDNNNANRVRPTSIYATLSNGTVVLLNEENGWTATVDNLPTRINGQPAVYTWSEQTVIGYRLTATRQEGNTTVFTNSVITTPETPAGNKTPKTPGGELAVFEEYETALGIQVYINHVGDCFD